MPAPLRLAAAAPALTSRPPVRCRGASRARIAAMLLLVACGYSVAQPPAGAAAPAQAGLHASFAPDRLGASTALTLALRFSGGNEGVAPPLRTLSLRLPAGLGINLGRSSPCPRARLRDRGAAGCPRSALLGRGRARLEVHAGSQTIPEQATLWVFRGPAGRGGAPTVEILGVGSTPLEERTISTGTLRREGAPFGSRLTITVPPIPTVVFEPDASFDSLSLTLGTSASDPRARAASARIVVPRRCPRGGFPFAAAIDFADGTHASAATSVRCP